MSLLRAGIKAADEGIEAVKETVEEAVKLAPKVVKFLKEEFKDNFDPEELALQTREAKKQGRRTPVDDFNKSIDYINNSKNSNEAKSRLQEMFEFNIGDVDEFIEEEGGINQVFKQVKSKKALGGSMLSREGYKDGGKTDVEKFISFENQIEEALNKATTPEERETIQRNGQQILDSFSNETKTEAYKQRAREAGISEEEINTPLFSHGGRMTKQEGSLMVPPEMEQDMPVDTYPNIPPEEMAEAEASQLPDAEMEDKYIDFVMDESLEEEEQSYLMNALEADPKLSQIFDKVMTTASEFTGSGEVEGPGTGVSDSIPARLSDGEFVFTKKATDEMGADNLQQMMDDAERAYDGGVMRRSAQEGGLLMYKQKDEDPLAYEKIAQDEIKKNMLRSNRAPSLNPGQI